MHLRRINEQTSLTTPWPRHQNLPQHAVQAMEKQLCAVKPTSMREQVADRAQARASHQGLVGALSVVKEDGLATVARVYVAKDVDPRTDAPELIEKSGIAKVEVHVRLLEMRRRRGRC